MSVYDCFTSGSYKNPPPIQKTSMKSEVWRGKVDFSYQNVATGDVVKGLEVPADSWIMAAWIQVITAATASAKANLGYSSDRNRWGTALKMDTAGFIVANVEESSGGGLAEIQLAATMPLYVSSAGTTIDLQITAARGGVAAITQGVVEVCAMIVRGD